MKIVCHTDIKDSEDALDAKSGNCVYLEENDIQVPVYLNNDTKAAWLGNSSANDDLKFKALKFVAALGYKPEVTTNG